MTRCMSGSFSVVKQMTEGGGEMIEERRGSRRQHLAMSLRLRARRRRWCAAVGRLAGGHLASGPRRRGCAPLAHGAAPAVAEHRPGAQAPQEREPLVADGVD